MDELRTQVMAAQHGDAEAFGEIVGRFRAMAVATGYAMLGDVHLAQDAAQDAFIEAYLSLNALREPAAFPGWFRRIVHKNADRQLRKHAREWPLDELRIMEMRHRWRLLAANAPVHIKDKGGRTALDWAIHKRHARIADALRAKGATSKAQTNAPIAPNRAMPILETGIKIVDFCAPLKRGVANAFFTPKSGVGKVVVIESLMQMMAENYGGHSLFLGVEQGGYNLRDMALQFHEAGLSDAVSLIFAQADDTGSFERAVDESMAAAKARQGEVLVFADAAFAERGLQQQIENARSENTTLIWYGDYTAGAEPENFAALNSLVTFELWRAYQGLWLTIDPLNSRSNLDVERARKLHAFLTQPFGVAEMYTNLLGEYVLLTDTLDGIEAILMGKVDEVREEKLRFIGGMDRWFRR